MKKTLTLIIAILMPLIMMGQGYNKLWSQVEEAHLQDMPKTALSVLDKIISQAHRKGDNDQLAKALIMKMYDVNDISRDSAEVLLPNIEKECSKHKSGIDHCIYQMILGWLYSCRTTITDPQTYNKAIRAFEAATRQTDILANTSSDTYLPLLVKEDDSRYFNHDMLSVVSPFVASRLREMSLPEADHLARQVMTKEIQWYTDHQKREAAMLAKIDSVTVFREDNSSFYKKIVSDYGDLGVSAVAYAWLCKWHNDENAYNLANEVLRRHTHTKYTNTFKNILSRIEQPRLNIHTYDLNTYPDEQIRLVYNYRNVKNATLRYYRLPYTATDPQWLDLESKDYPKLARNATFTQELPLRHGQPYEGFKDTISLTVPQPGIYLIEVSGSDFEASYRIARVSRLAVMQLPQPEEKVRICVTDYKNGKPVPYSTVKLRIEVKDSTHWQQYTTDQYGQLTIERPKGSVSIFASTEDDKALAPETMEYSRSYRWNSTESETIARIYTDRSIYRPGQQVNIGGFLYDKENDSTIVLPQQNLDIEVLDANHKKLQTITVVTDDLGAFAADYTLPQECLNGTFTLRNTYGRTTFKVEEYKRPKFKVTINKPEGGYVLGDTVVLSGEVMTYSGLPMENTTVYCSSERNRSWWFRYAESEAPVTVRDTVTTDSEGKFTLPVVLTTPTSSDSYWRPMCYTYTVKAKATADDGETEENTISIFAGNTKTFVNANIPSIMCKEKMPVLSATQNNAMGEAVSGDGNYILVRINPSNQPARSKAASSDTIRRGTLAYNQAGQLDFITTLPSGQYKILLFPTGETNHYRCNTYTFTLLSLTDTKPVGTKPLQVWHSSSQYSYTEPVDIMIGTPLKDSWLRYDLMANGRLVDSQIIQLSDTVIRMQLKWDESLGRGAYAVFALLDNGQLHTESLVLTKPLPDKNLQLRWTTFRDKLQPGSEERWTLRILRHGKPVDASILTTIYDASLDKFGKHQLPFSLSYNRYVPELHWDTGRRNTFSTYMSKSYEDLSEDKLSFTHFNNNLFGYNPFDYYSYRLMPLRSALGGRDYKAGMLREVEVRPMAMAKSVDYMDAHMVEAEEELSMQADNAMEIEPDITANIELRSNFNETAFFTSTLRTDANGEATIEFKMPESLTSWNIMTLAHTADLCYVFNDSTITVQKPLMVQANMPRFLRSGDKTSLAVTVRNNSDLPQSGKAQLALIDAQSGKQLKLLTNTFSLEPGKTTNIDFPIEVSADQPMLICRYAASTDNFSDGEQQYITVLSDLQKTISTVPFMINDGQTHTLSLDTLHYNPAATHSLLTIEYTGNPAWTAISALPSTVNYNTKCATQLAINYNALTLMRQIIADNPQLTTAIRQWQQQDSVPTFFAQMQNNPELKLVALEHTPWIGDADHERSRLNSLMQDDQTLSLKQASMLHKLKDMQGTDGAWSWYPGMPGSTWLTLDIAEMLSRTRTLCPSAASEIDQLLLPALRFLDKKADEEVKYIKQHKLKYVPTMWMRYLYTKLGVRGEDTNLKTPTLKYLVKHLQKSSTQYDLYNKAMAAVILQQAGRVKQARLTLKSLMEYTVSRPEMGTYFDSRRAPYSWSMYKVPTQVAAIEALRSVSPDDKTTADQMRLWLLQSKHTQMWDEPLAATQTINCLLQDGMLASPTALPAQLDLNLTTRQIIPVQEYATIEPFVQAGYIKATFNDSILGAAPASLTVRQSAATVEQPLSYGAAYLQSWQPALATPAAGSELTLTLQLYKETASGWLPISTDEKLRKGDRVMVRYDIEASRDFDFVALRDGRPACFEPTSTSSGYNWRQSSYRSVEDEGTIWYFDRLAKGHHAIEETYDVDRTGTFSSACPQVQCQYAPEFTARAKAISITVEE